MGCLLVAGVTCNDGKGIQSALGKLHWLLDLPIFSQTVQWSSWACTCSHESEWPHKGITWWTVHILGWNSARILWSPNCMLPFLKPILQICHLFVYGSAGFSGGCDVRLAFLWTPILGFRLRLMVIQHSCLYCLDKTSECMSFVWFAADKITYMAWNHPDHTVSVKSARTCRANHAGWQPNSSYVSCCCWNPTGEHVFL